VHSLTQPERLRRGAHAHAHRRFPPTLSIANWIAAVSSRRSSVMPVVMDQDRMNRTLTRIAHEILERNRGDEGLALVGIRTRGVPLARRLAATIRSINQLEVPTGALDITLYRDDLMRHAIGVQPVVRSTDIPFSIDNKRILLVDD